MAAPFLETRLDSLAPAEGGSYADELITVTHRAGGPGAGVVPSVSTPHFALLDGPGRVELSHRIAVDQVDADLVDVIGAELFDRGWLSGDELFDRVLTGVVLSTVDSMDPLRAWDTFYDNTITRFRRHWAGLPVRAGTIGRCAGAYRQALRMVPPGKVLDLASGYGFLSLLVAARPTNSALACDPDASRMALLHQVSRHRRTPVRTLIGGPARVALPDRSVDTVTAIHLLHELPADERAAVLTEALRLARRRVLVCYPEHADRAEAIALAQSSGRRFTVTDRHGLWLAISTG